MSNATKIDFIESSPHFEKVTTGIDFGPRAKYRIAGSPGPYGRPEKAYQAKLCFIFDGTGVPATVTLTDAGRWDFSWLAPYEPQDIMNKSPNQLRVQQDQRIAFLLALQAA